MINDVASYYGISEAPHGGSGFERLGTHAFAPWTARNGSSKIRGRGSVAAYAKPWWYGYSEDFAAAAGSVVESCLRQAGSAGFKRCSASAALAA